MNKNQFLMIALVFATIVNVVVHFSSPAYSEYKFAVRRLDDEFSRFRRQVTVDFLPAFSNYVFSSRQVQVIERETSSLVSTNSPVASLSNFERSAKVPDPKKIYGFVGSVNGRYILHSGHWDFFVGDIFDGSPIVDISKQSITTELCVYRVEPEKREPVVDSSSSPDNGLVVRRSPDLYQGPSS